MKKAEYIFKITADKITINQIKCLGSFCKCKCIILLKGKEFYFACWSWKRPGKWWKKTWLPYACIHKARTMPDLTLHSRNPHFLSHKHKHTHTHTHTAVSPAGLLTRLQKKTSPLYKCLPKTHTREKIHRYFTSDF
jgi:hypothetical protein